MSDVDINENPENSCISPTKSIVPDTDFKEQIIRNSESYDDGNDHLNISCHKEPQDVKQGTDCDVTIAKRRLRKQSSSNITDILNLAEENSDDDHLTDVNKVENVKSDPVNLKVRHQPELTKKRSRHLRKRKWRPYHKLTWKEREKVEERNKRRAQRVRDELRAVGIALAPSNNNEFLMNDRQLERSPDYEAIERFKENVEKNLNEYMDRDFEEQYQAMKSQFINKLTKFELVERWIDREDQIEELEKQLNAMREKKRLLGLDGVDIVSEMAKIEVFKEEINKLVDENEALFLKNEKLKKYLLENS